MRQSHPLFDVESAIVKAKNQPSPVDLKPWQDRIDKIVGKTLDGKPRLRLVWGQGPEATAIICGERRCKYPFWRYEEGGQILDVGTPRFYVEELHTNAELQYRGAWDKSRYYWDEVTRESIDVLGPIPEEGFYTSVFLIAHHDYLCCNGAGVVNREPCLGAYRPPTDSDLQRIRRMKQRRDAASNAENSPSESQLRKREEDATVARDEKWRQGIRDRIDEYVKTRSHSWTTLDPGVLSHGKWHWAGAGSKSGATPEQIEQWRKEKASNAISSNSAGQDGA